MQTFKPFETSSAWTFVDPDTNYKYVECSRAALVQMIISYRTLNKLPEIERLDLVLDNFLCNLHCNQGKCKELKLQRGLLQYLKGGIALVQNLYFKEFTTQEEADRRAEICITCSCNQFPDRDAFLKWADSIALASVGDRKSKHHEALGNCMACSCLLSGKVWYAGKLNLTEEEEYKLAECNKDCWQICDEDK